MCFMLPLHSHTHYSVGNTENANVVLNFSFLFTLSPIHTISAQFNSCVCSKAYKTQALSEGREALLWWNLYVMSFVIGHDINRYGNVYTMLEEGKLFWKRAFCDYAHAWNFQQTVSTSIFSGEDTAYSRVIYLYGFSEVKKLKGNKVWKWSLLIYNWIIFYFNMK